MNLKVGDRVLIRLWEQSVWNKGTIHNIINDRCIAILTDDGKLHNYSIFTWHVVKEEDGYTEKDLCFADNLDSAQLQDGNAVCPFCGDVVTDNVYQFELSDGDSTEVECDSCGEYFDVTVTYSISCTSSYTEKYIKDKYEI